MYWWVGYGCDREKARIILDMMGLENVYSISFRQIMKGRTTQSSKLPTMGKVLVDGP